MKLKVQSAKDKAFNEERLHLMKEAEKWRHMVIERDQQLSEAEKRIKALEAQNAALYKQIEEHLHMTPEQFDEHIHRDMRGIEAIEFLKHMTRGMPFGVY